MTYAFRRAEYASGQAEDASVIDAEANPTHAEAMRTDADANVETADANGTNAEANGANADASLADADASVGAREAHVGVTHAAAVALDVMLFAADAHTADPDAFVVDADVAIANNEANIAIANASTAPGYAYVTAGDAHCHDDNACSALEHAADSSSCLRTSREEAIKADHHLTRTNHDANHSAAHRTSPAPHHNQPVDDATASDGQRSIALGHRNGRARWPFSFAASITIRRGHVMNARQHAVLDALDLSRRFFHDNNLFARSNEADRDVHGLDAMVIDSTSHALDHNEMGANLENDS